MGTAETHFSNQVSGLDNSYELILLDLPGHGNASIEASDNYFEDALNYVTAQIKVKGEGYIIGLSLGASLAIHIAIKEPELVKGIILTGYSPFIPEELKGIMEKQYEYFINIEDNDRNIAEHFKKLHGDKWRRTIKSVLHTMTFNYPTATQEDIRNIRVPMLILNGSNELHEVEAVTYVKKINNDAKVGLVPNAGHTANIDQPGTYNKMLENFIEDIS
ncbi:alpha/beta fold hydrolase [Alkalihalobacillus sp. EGI L200015]|nr:alpha/beta fold hydrolase [Pseudalkalibacillus salsuginis]